MQNTDKALKEDFNDLEFTGRKSNTKLDNFRLYGKSKHQQYFTPVELCNVVYEMLLPAIDEKNVKGVSVLDPTCG